MKINIVLENAEGRPAHVGMIDTDAIHEQHLVRYCGRTYAFRSTCGNHLTVVYRECADDPVDIAPHFSPRGEGL